MATRKATARNTTSFDFAAALATLKQDILNELRNPVATSAPVTAPAVTPEAPKSRKTKPAVTPAASSTPAVVDFALEGKKQACFKAAKAAVKAAGLQWNGVKGAGSKGGKFENPTAYWAAYWAGYNAKAKELGIPEHTK